MSSVSFDDATISHLDGSHAGLLAQVSKPDAVVADDEAASGVGDEDPLRDVEAGVGGGVNGCYDTVAGHLDAAGLANDQHHPLVCAGIETAVGRDLDVGEALRWCVTIEGRQKKNCRQKSFRKRSRQRCTFCITKLI